MNSELRKSYLIVGLGNPGKQYENTRHNLGYDVVHALAKKHHWNFQKKSKLRGYLARGTLEHDTVYLLISQDYINESGRSLHLCKEYLNIPLTHIMVVVDDAAIDFGELRLKPSGSSGGHNGLKNIEKELGSHFYPRLRIGVGSPEERDLNEHVLGNFHLEEKKELPEIYKKAIEAIELWILEGIAIAMNQANLRRR